jgi:hypothetical protein
MIVENNMFHRKNKTLEKRIYLSLSVICHDLPKEKFRDLEGTSHVFIVKS